MRLDHLQNRVRLKSGVDASPNPYICANPSDLV